MISKVVVALSVALSVLMVDAAQAAVISRQGSLSDPDQVLLFELSIGSASTLNIQGFGYGGGINGAGSVVGSGGFDTIVALFYGLGSSATLIEFNDDGICPPASFDPITGGCLDSTLYRDLLLLGDYTIALTASFNTPIGSTLGAGFSGGGSFVDVFGDSRTSNYALDVTINSLQQIPEPSSFVLVVTSMLLLLVRHASRIRSALLQNSRLLLTWSNAKRSEDEDRLFKRPFSSRHTPRRALGRAPVWLLGAAVAR